MGQLAAAAAAGEDADVEVADVPEPGPLEVWLMAGDRRFLWIWAINALSDFLHSRSDRLAVPKHTTRVSIVAELALTDRDWMLGYTGRWGSGDEYATGSNDFSGSNAPLHRMSQ